MTFAGSSILAPNGLETDEFILRPILPSDAQLDYDAVMESRVFLRKWEQSTWPEDDFTVEANREDMVKMQARHLSGESYSYTVMNADQTECFGCVYLFPSDTKWFSDVEVTALGAEQWSDCDGLISFWVSASQMEKGMDRTLLDTLLEWFDQEWAFKAAVIVTNEQFVEQVAMLDNTDLERRFIAKLAKHEGRYIAYN